MVIKGIDGFSGMNGISPLSSQKGAKEVASSSPANGAGRFVGEFVNKVNDLQVDADKSIQRFATGEAGGMHEVMLAVEKSSIAFQFMTQVRNKALEAYQEVMRMQV